MTNFPVLKCFPINADQVKAWCPFCKKWHIHGYTDDIKNNKSSHRVAHCTVENSPFKKTEGYTLKIMSKKERKEIAKSLE